MAPILQLLKEQQAAFDPEATLAMSAAFDAVCNALKLNGETVAVLRLAERAGPAEGVDASFLRRQCSRSNDAP